MQKFNVPSSFRGSMWTKNSTSKKKTQIVVLVVSFIWLYTCVWGTKILWNRLVSGQSVNVRQRKYEAWKQ